MFVFSVLHCPKNPQHFCSLKIISLEKQKFVNIYCFYQILKFYKYWITESQQIRKIVIRKFAIFSSGLIFKAKLFFNGYSKKRTIEYLKITLFKIFKLNFLESINSALSNQICFIYLSSFLRDKKVWRIFLGRALDGVQK